LLSNTQGRTVIDFDSTGEPVRNATAQRRAHRVRRDRRERPDHHASRRFATRKLLLAAARQGLSTSTEFYVNQLFVQGDTALGDLDPVTKTAGKRVLVAWEHRDGAWSTIAISTFGLANAAETARALPSFSSELISKINWTLAPVSLAPLRPRIPRP